MEIFQEISPPEIIAKRYNRSTKRKPQKKGLNEAPIYDALCTVVSSINQKDGLRDDDN